MATVNFYLKEPSAKIETPINVRFHYEGNRLKFSSGEKIHPKFWNSENQRVKKSFPGSVEVNSYLDRIEEETKKVYRTAITNGINLSNDLLKEQIFKGLNKQTEKRKSFFDYYTEFIEVNRGMRKPSRILIYETFKKHLLEFQHKKNYKLNFESINGRFYELFYSYLISEMKFLNNTVGKYFKVLKTFLHWATKRGYNTELSFTKFKTPSEDADIIYLTEIELMKLYNCDLSKDIRLEKLRDVFCFGCFTGLRFSDIERLKKENIKGEQIQFNTKKTKDSLTVPLNDYALEILMRYDYHLPVISNQRTNEYLKELGELVGIDDRILLTKYRGTEEIQFKEPKYKFLSSHTARRTFVTLSLEKGMRPETVMSITGHKDYKTFRKYIKITSKVKVAEMKQVWKREPEAKTILSLVS